MSRVDFPYSTMKSGRFGASQPRQLAWPCHYGLQSCLLAAFLDQHSCAVHERLGLAVLGWGIDSAVAF